MKRYEFRWGHPVSNIDGEWIRYEDHCEAMKRRAAPSASAQQAEPVAVVGAGFQLCWIGSGPIAPIVEQHGIKVGDKLYAAPAPCASPADVNERIRKWRDCFDRMHQRAMKAERALFELTLTDEDIERQYKDGIHIGSGLPRATCPCGFCQKYREPRVLAAADCKCRRLGDWNGEHHPLCDANQQSELPAALTVEKIVAMADEAGIGSHAATRLANALLAAMSASKDRA